MKKPALKVVSSKKLSPVAGDTPIVFGGSKIFTVTIPTSDLFSDFRSNANQRDTELRSTKHLTILRPEHLSLNAMLTMSGALILLDGHTRTLFWKNNPAIAPNQVRMTVYEIIDPLLNEDDEELRLYTTFDSRTAVKTSAHTIQGTMRSISLNMTTPWLRAGHFANALRVAAEFCNISSTTSPDILMNEFRAELAAFDSILPKKGEFISPFTASAIIMMRKAPRQQVLELLESYQSNDASKLLQNGLNHSIYKILRDYRSEGLSGTGNFPTNGADMSAAVTKICKLFHLALTTGETTMINPSSVRPYNRTKLKELVVSTSEIVTPI